MWSSLGSSADAEQQTVAEKEKGKETEGSEAAETAASAEEKELEKETETTAGQEKVRTYLPSKYSVAYHLYSVITQKEATAQPKEDTTATAVQPNVHTAGANELRNSELARQAAAKNLEDLGRFVWDYLLSETHQSVVLKARNKFTLWVSTPSSYLSVYLFRSPFWFWV